MQVIVTLITLLFYLYHLHIASRTHGLFIYLFYNFSLYAYGSDDHFDHISDHICSSYVPGSRRQVRGGDGAWPIGRFVQHQPTGADILRLHHDRAGALNLGSVRERCCKGGRRKKAGIRGVLMPETVLHKTLLLCKGRDAVQQQVPQQHSVQK